MFTAVFQKIVGRDLKDSILDLPCVWACASLGAEVGCDAMTRRRWIVLLAASLIAVAVIWLWWVNPRTADMAAYAPAEAVLYLEANRPGEIFETVGATEAWKAVEKAMGAASNDTKRHWLQGFVRGTGIGPVQSVVLSRAQVAVVVTDIGTTESGDTLKVTTEAAILIETHTAETRIKPLFEETLKALAEKTYGRPTERGRFR